MDPVLQTFLSWQFLIFSVGVASIVFVLRKLAEYFIGNYKAFAKESKLWNDLIMPISPILVGVICALLIKAYPYPNSLTSTGSRFIFGLVAGLLSTVVYRLIKVFINQKIGTALPPGSDPTSDEHSMSAGKNLDE